MNFIWLFLDFSAYSDVAVGLGTLMGIATPENFRQPYLARNVIEFWERWHISLSRFIRRQLFIPAQLALMRWTDGRFPLLAASVAFTFSFVLCGLWHGLSWPWFAWGIVQSAGLVVCNLYRVALNRRLGRKGMSRYLANPWARVAAIILTFEFAAAAVAVATYPYQELTLVEHTDAMSAAKEAQIPATHFAVRTAWVAVRLILVYYLGQQGLLFFYQTF